MFMTTVRVTSACVIDARLIAAKAISDFVNLNIILSLWIIVSNCIDYLIS